MFPRTLSERKKAYPEFFGGSDQTMPEIVSSGECGVGRGIYMLHRTGRYAVMGGHTQSALSGTPARQPRISNTPFFQVRQEFGKARRRWELAGLFTCFDYPFRSGHEFSLP
jgi:hypothetical protein